MMANLALDFISTVLGLPLRQIRLALGFARVLVPIA